MKATELEKKSLKEFLDMKTIVESYQGAPEIGRHDKTQALKTINDLLAGDDIGIITLAETETGSFARLDGNSRYNDIRKFLTGDLALIQRDSENKKIEVKFSELPKEKQKAFFEAEMHLFVYYGMDKEERAKKFVKLNSSKNLTAVQKNKGYLSENFENACRLIQAYCTSHNIITDRKLLNDEQVAITAQIIANIHDVYSSSNAKLIEAIRPLEINIEALGNILDMLQNDKAHNKYSFISAVSVLYSVGDTNKIRIQKADRSGFEAHEVKIADLNLVNRLCFNFEKSGTNSAPVNAERLETTKKELDILCKEYVIANRGKDTRPELKTIKQKVTAADLATS